MNSKFLIFVSLLSLLITSRIFASEKDVYEFSWLDPDKEVYVLQNRKYRKAGHLYVNGGGGVTTSGAFVAATNFQGRAGYFISEDFGLETVYSKNSGKENDTAKSIRANTNNTGSTPFRRIVDNYYGALFVWSPFYSKINTFNKIIYMDWIFGVGYAQLTEHNNSLRFTVGQSAEGNETTESHSGLIWEVGMKFYLSESFSIRTDFVGTHYQALDPKLDEKNYYSNFDAAISLGYTF